MGINTTESFFEKNNTNYLGLFMILEARNRFQKRKRF